jgi:uncharacterized protein YchJ
MGLMLVGLAFGLVACGEGPGDAVENMMYAVDAGEYEQAIEYMPPKLRAMADKEKLIQMMRAGKQELEQKGGLDGVEVLEETVDGNKATVKVKTTYGNGESETEELKLMKVDDQWVLSDEDMNANK